MTPATLTSINTILPQQTINQPSLKNPSTSLHYKNSIHINPPQLPLSQLPSQPTSTIKLPLPHFHQPTIPPTTTNIHHTHNNHLTTTSTTTPHPQQPPTNNLHLQKPIHYPTHKNQPTTPNPIRELLVNPMVRSVVVMEPLFATIHFKRVLSHVLFMQYEVPSIYFASSPILSLLSLAIPVAMVVDCGYRETVILPVYHSFPIFKACQVVPVASKAIHSHLKEQLMIHGVVKTDQNTQESLNNFKDKVTEELLENIKVKTCFVTTYDRAQQIRKALHNDDVTKPESPPDVEYPLDGKLTLNIPGSIREETCELLFERGDDDDRIASLIIQAILKCPIDSRKQMAENIVMLGGTCMLAGFKGRLLNELKAISREERYKDLLNNYSFKIHTTPCHENIAGWLGGAIFSAVEVVLSMRTTPREQYIATHRVPDWGEIRDKGDWMDDRFKETPYAPTPRSDISMML